ncbi:hypothetical protein EDD15DRAFT_2165647 [Pisolithus albus]|nr:hypothetical protein EDD15DRAFT_2165647 [Pisolithus albus]
MEQLVNAYLDYRYRDTGDGLPAPEESEASTQYLMDVELVDMFTRRCATLPYKLHHLYPNEVLIYHGYIGCSPVLPTVSVSLRTLASYHQIHRICPRFGIQAQTEHGHDTQCKLLCHLHDTPYCPYLNVQLTIAYDVYLDILGRVNCQIKKALGCDTDNWQMLNSCPACFYRLEDEPALDFDWLVSIDGNNSLKRWDTSTYGVSPRVDTRHACSDYWLDDDYVDRFKYEVSSRTNHDSDTDNWQDLASADPDVPTSFTCVEQWRNAGPEQRKRMFSMFHETGIFIASCHHRFVLLFSHTICAKYPLAVISKLMSVYSKNGGCAYDIGCAFSTTLRNSSLGPQSEDLKLHMMVGAFHGHAHNRMCQLDWHPCWRLNHPCVILVMVCLFGCLHKRLERTLYSTLLVLLPQ